MGRRKERIEEYLNNFMPEPNTGCWLWLGTLNYSGYAQVCINNWTRSAHKVSYQVFIGLVPKGMELDHTCRMRCCINPRHLEPVTHKENLRRGKIFELGEFQKSKTHCPLGHEYTGANLVILKKGRGCRTCRVNRTRQWRDHERWNTRN